MIARLYDPELLIIVVLVLVMALILVSGGKGLGELVGFILRKIGIGKTEVVVNLERGEMAKIPKECEGCGLVIDPSKCVMHTAEHERSMRNEGQIAKIWEEYGMLRKDTLAAAAALRNETIATASKLKDDTVAAATKLKDEMIAGFDRVNTSIAASNSQILGALAGDRNGFSKIGRGGGEG